MWLFLHKHNRALRSVCASLHCRNWHFDLIFLICYEVWCGELIVFFHWFANVHFFKTLCSQSLSLSLCVAELMELWLQSNVSKSSHLCLSDHEKWCRQSDRCWMMFFLFFSMFSPPTLLWLSSMLQPTGKQNNVFYL